MPQAVGAISAEWPFVLPHSSPGEKWNFKNHVSLVVLSFTICFTFSWVENIGYKHKVILTKLRVYIGYIFGLKLQYIFLHKNPVKNYLLRHTPVDRLIFGNIFSLLIPEKLCWDLSKMPATLLLTVYSKIWEHLQTGMVVWNHQGVTKRPKLMGTGGVFHWKMPGGDFASRALGCLDRGQGQPGKLGQSDL